LVFVQPELHGPQDSAAVVGARASRGLDAARVMVLQRAAGNRATSALVASRRPRARGRSRARRGGPAPARRVSLVRVRLAGRALTAEQLRDEFIRQCSPDATRAELDSMRAAWQVPTRGTLPEEVAQGFVDIAMTVDVRTQAAIDALPEDLRRLLLAESAGATALAPREYARVVRVAGKLAALSAVEREDYLARVTAATTSLAEVEASIDAYVRLRAGRDTQELFHRAAAERLAGCEAVYAAHRHLKFLRAAQQARPHDLDELYQAAGGELVKQAVADFDEEVAGAEGRLSAALRQKRFDSIAAFETAIEAYRVSFRTQAVNLAHDVLARYEHMLFLERSKLAAGGTSEIVRGIAATQARALYAVAHEEQRTAEDWRSGRDPQARDARLEEKITEHAHAAAAATEQADAEVRRGAGDWLVAERGVDREAIAGLDAEGLSAHLRALIDERSRDAQRARTELDQDPDRVFGLPGLVDGSMALLHIQPDSVHARIIDDWIADDKASHVLSELALGVLAAALVALVPGGGWIAAAALVANSAISAYQAYTAIDEYTREQRDWRLGFLTEQPSLAWVAIAVVAAAADLGVTAATLLKQSAGALKALEATLTEFSTAEDPASRLARLRAALAKANDLSAELKAALEREAEAFAASKRSSNDLANAVAGTAYVLLPGLVDPTLVTKVFRALYHWVRKGAKTLRRLSVEAKFIEHVGFIAPLPAAGRKELEAALKEVRWIVETGDELHMDEGTLLAYLDRWGFKRTDPAAIRDLRRELREWRPLSAFASRQEFRRRMLERLARLQRERPPGWPLVDEALKLEPDQAVRSEIAGLLERVMDALQNPELYADELADAWQLVHTGQAANINTALIVLAERGGVPVREIRELMSGTDFFEQVASHPGSWVDRNFVGGWHGALTHLLQDLVVDRALGTGASSRFRVLLGRATGRVDRYVYADGYPYVMEPFSTLPNSAQLLPNSIWKNEDSITVGDYIFRFTYDLLYPTYVNHLSRMPQPELLGPMLRSLAGVD